MYFVLNPDRPLPEHWSKAKSSVVDAWFGDTSHFCFLRHPGTARWILVGVSKSEISSNSWYDGPFDQVPPYLPIRKVLEEAYPYVKDAGGIDEHGNFLQMVGQRVAISPYQDYESGPEFVTFLEGVVTKSPGPEAWTSATYEYKRDWRSPNAVSSPPSHQQGQSASWPANHWGGSSREWGAAHEKSTSRNWPANHALTTSREKNEDHP